VFKTLDEANRALSADELAVYDLVWKRTIASQMVDARLTQDRVRLSTTLTAVATYDGPVEVELNATGLRIEFAGFRRAYVEGSDDPEAELADNIKEFITKIYRLEKKHLILFLIMVFKPHLMIELIIIEK
jgi:DNA topoisomerase-1